MLVHRLTTGLGVLLVVAALLSGSERASPAAVKQLSPIGAEPGCAGGCSLAAHDVPTLSDADYRRLLEDFAAASEDVEGGALDTLLFHGADVRAFLEREPITMSAERLALLDRELSRTHARVFLRVIDDEGKVHTQVDGARVPLDEKQHLAGSNPSLLRPHEFNGTVKRVGQHHLWTRM